MEQFVSTHFPSLVQLNVLENYFTHGHFVSDRYHQRYTHSSISVLTYFQDYGGNFSKCLRGTGAKHHQAVSPEMTFGNRHTWDTVNEGLYKFKHKFKIHYGHAAFGMCQSPYCDGPSRIPVDKPTTGNGQVLIMQDPFLLAMAHYGTCLMEPGDNFLCQLAHKPGTTFEDWVVLRGSVVFKSLVFNSGICTKPSTTSNNSSRGNVPLHDLCELNLNQHLQNLEPKMLKYLLNYILNHLHTWFALVGVYEDLNHSLYMLNQVFRLPLHDCEFLSQFDDKSTFDQEIFKNMNAEPKTDQHTSGYNTNDNTSDLSLESLLTSSRSEVSLLESLSQLEADVAKKDLQEPKSIPTPDSDNALLSDYDIIDIINIGDNNNQNNSKNTYHEDNVDIPENSYFEDLNSNGSSLTFEDYEDESAIDDISSLDDIFTEHILSYKARRLKTNTAWDQVYNRLVNDERVLAALSMDIQIYKAVKNLYKVQKLYFLNSR